MKDKNKIYFYIVIFLILILILIYFNFNFKFSNYKERFAFKEFREKHPEPIPTGFTKDDDWVWSGDVAWSSLTVTPTQCVNMCAQLPECKVAMYDGDDSRCWNMKTSSYGREPARSRREQKYMAWPKNAGYVYQTANVPGWTVEKNISYNSNPISYTNQRTPEICINNCAVNALCKGVVYDTVGSYCIEFPNVDSKSTHDGSMYYAYKKPPPIAAIDAPSGWTRELSVDYPGNDIKSIQGSTPNNCLDSCKTTADCKGFVFDSNSNTCYLKSLLTTNRINSTPNLYAYKDQLDPATLPTGWTYEAKKDYPGYNITSVSGLTPTLCVNSCPKNDGTCKGVIYDSYNEICYKKSSFQTTSTTSTNTGSVTQSNNTPGVNPPNSNKNNTTNKGLFNRIKNGFII